MVANAGILVLLSAICGYLYQATRQAALRLWAASFAIDRVRANYAVLGRPPAPGGGQQRAPADRHRSRVRPGVAGLTRAPASLSARVQSSPTQ